MKLAALSFPTVAVLASAAAAQNDITWLDVSNDNARLSAPANLGVNDVEEKDYAWADLDKDGRTDLVVMRKEPFTTAGRRPNVLFMNENGVLVDRTSEYASASDVPGDQGFLTPTNDRDVVIADVDLDGWLDVVTSPVISPGEPKHISHPRVYMNLGNDGGGNWLGLFYEDARIDDWGTHANFCGIDAGDVTGDGYPDLYLSHYSSGAEIDLNDRLLINDGNGFFTDETVARIGSFGASGFGTSTTIVDLNGDGVNDVVDGESGIINLLYNDPNDEGFFNILDTPYAGLPYHANAGDLNKDGKPDIVSSDDGQDRYILNQGNDALGRVIWSAAHTYNTDDGFASNNYVIDLNGDGWAESLHADVDVDIPGCGRRLHIYHNRGGTVGGFVTMREEAGSGWTAATGLTSSQLVGMHDVAVFDIDGDGDMDMVFGRCTGTSVWLQAGSPEPVGTVYCDTNAANAADISVSTADCGAGSIVVSMSGAPASQFGYLLVGKGSGTVTDPPGAEGDLCLTGSQIGRYSSDAGVTSASGALSTDVLNAISGGGGGNVPNPPGGNICSPSGQTWNFQYWHRDGMNPSKFSKAISVTFQ